MKDPEFRNICQREGLDYDMFDFHYTDARSVLSYKAKKTNDTSARFLILAINELEIFAIWDLNDVVIPIREIYSVRKKQVLDLMVNESLSKAVEYPNRGSERVYLIPFNAILYFSNNIIK